MTPNENSDIELGRELADRLINERGFYKRITEDENRLLRKFVEFHQREIERLDRLYMEDSKPILSDLREAGFDCGEDFAQIIRRPEWLEQKIYTKAVPILVKWLAAVENPRVKEWIIRCLTVPWASPYALRPLLDMFATMAAETSEEQNLKWVVGQAISVLMNRDVKDEILAIARDARHGYTRGAIVHRLWKLKDSRAVTVLREILKDKSEYEKADYVRLSALHSLRMMAPSSARSLVERFVGHPNSQLRNEGKKALQKIDKAIAKQHTEEKATPAFRRTKRAN